MPVPTLLINARLPRWYLPADWPQQQGQPQLADIPLSRLGRAEPRPAGQPPAADAQVLDLQGRLLLPPLLEAHAHLDKTYTRSRLGALQPGLLPAIEAMRQDQQQHWNAADLRQRSERALQAAWDAGSRLLRSHVDWIDADQTPLAWDILGEQALRWQPRLRLQRVALVPLPLLADAGTARTLVEQVAASGDALMGAFIHSSNFDAQAIHQLVACAAAARVDLDLHIDEELSGHAAGLECLLDALEALPAGFPGRIVCGHLCALASQPEDSALALLERVAAQPITLVALPATNLFLQDARPGRTPRQRGLTLLHEAAARDIPLLLASDNVQDAFNPLGNYDPLEALHLGVLAAHLDEPFDRWSRTICDAAALGAEMPAGEWLVFDSRDPWSWPSEPRHHLLRAGEAAPAALLSSTDAPRSRR